MKTIEQLRLQPRLSIQDEAWDGGQGWAELHSSRKPERCAIIFSWGGGWEHVSVSFRSRIPSWEEMCEIKDLFFHKNETVLQFHPEEAEYVNEHSNCLHLWRKRGQNAELPPWWMVGTKKGMTWEDTIREAEAYLKTTQEDKQ
jgi:hypothetical protein